MRHYLDWLSEAIRENWDKPALSDCLLLYGGEGRAYTYGSMYRQIVALQSLISESGLQPGDHIAICGANSSNWLVSYLAVAASRCVAVPILHTQTPESMSFQITYADCKALFVDPDIWSVPEVQALPDVLQVFSLEDFSVLKGKPLPLEVEPDMDKKDASFNTGSLDDLAQICFTSGSTQDPKAVMLSFRNISNNVRDAVETFPYGHNFSVLSTLPLAHIYGLMDEVLGHLPSGHHVHFMRQMSFGELRNVLHMVDPYVLLTVPLLFEQICSRKGDALSDLFGPGLRQIFVGGSKLDSEVEDAVLSFGLPLTVGYGSTETAPLISASRAESYVPHSCGRIVSGMEARVSEEGEILVRGDNVMLGYYKNPEATRRKIDADGWLHTGDRGRVDDDGTVYVYGRMEQDMIVLPSGENIIPQNIEAMLDRIDGVAESLVLERSGQLVALVYPRETGLDKNALLRAVNVQLPSFSQISEIEFVPEPFQRTGKSGIKRYLYQPPQKATDQIIS